MTTGHKIVSNMFRIEGTSCSPITQKDMEIIPENPSDEIILHVEEIPPLDVFYSPKHRAVVKRQRKKIKLDQTSLLPAQMEMANVVWREEVNPSEDLKKSLNMSRNTRQLLWIKHWKSAIYSKKKIKQLFHLRHRYPKGCKG